MRYLYLLCALLTAMTVKAQSTHKDTLLLADPTIFAEDGQYYLYGTGSAGGFPVYQSSDMVNWKGGVGKAAHNLALAKGDSYGTKGFWAPQIFKNKGKYYMAYAANEDVAIAEGDSPLGPFKQQDIKKISGPTHQIDPFIFKDTDGKLYLYFVRLQNGNRVFVAPLKDDLSDIDTAAAKECANSNLPWENTANSKWPVCEGPTVIKHNGLYYLMYSSNDYQNIDYAIGYATSKSPMGPWTKNPDNPIISRHTIGINGTGHGDVFIGKDGQLYYVMHTHYSNTKVQRRKTAVIKLAFSKDKPAKLVADKDSFRYLTMDSYPVPANR
ncbi:glycoside hydrolase family 43 protein [Mucilaginibacter sp. dw_454]|uniref:glycoside hydrolase family 43 protein n=1 Tax=Mucilaginibacter sp. dw_454 TaxID=2720079 RepID=UPI001BD54631|nr:glycoside hydrolase family 43 protein [Mucilaginibacter sp. dw_454]